ncbi:hypothetical protein [Ralstonia phage Reminis]|uniref:Uncharacterized protein n=1 Tax=Ralstonia phage Reminis TaxID=2662139 RepID=A0A5Q2U8K8_9CAUD|nr:hypothetical protein [Ralstonia phage Reminis]
MNEMHRRFDEIEALIDKLQAARAKVEPFGPDWWAITDRITQELNRMTSVNRTCLQQMSMHYTTGLPADLRVGL